MPDAAIEAHKAGLDYTEPTGKNIKKAKVHYEYVFDPNNPHAPPRQRRVIGAADSGGLFGKWFKGEKPTTIAPVPMQATIIQPAQQIEYDFLGRPKPPKPQPRYLPQLQDQGQHQQAWNQPPILLEPTPLPPNIDSMPWGERRSWYKMRDEQIKGIKMMQKAAKDGEKAQMKEMKIKQKALDKERARELKAQEKQLRWLRKHPHRNLPMPSYPMNTAPGQMQMPPPPDPLSFMLIPTGEEFGVRRPFNAPGLPRSLGGPPGHAGWPMMSRTMTHAVRDLTLEERVHAIQSGRVWGPTW